MEDYLDPFFLNIIATAVPITASATTIPTIMYMSVFEMDVEIFEGFCCAEDAVILSD